MTDLVQLFIVLPLKIFVNILFLIQNICLDLIQILTYINFNLRKDEKGE